MENINDPTNLTGISKLLNKSHVNDKLDLSALEKDMIGGTGLRKVKVNDPAKEFQNKMREINRLSGMEMLSTKSHRKAAAASSSSFDNSGSYDDSDDSDDSDGSDDSGESYDSDDSGESYDSDDSNDSGSFDSDDSGSDDDIISKIKSSDRHMRPVSSSYRPIEKPKTHAPSTVKYGSHNRPDKHRRPPPGPPNVYGGQPQYPPMHHQMAAPGYNMPQQYPGMHGGDSLDQAMHAYGGNAPNFAIESIEDDEEKKSELLEDIDELKWELEDDDVDLSRIPDVDQDSSIEEILTVRKILRRKYDRRRFNSFGTEFILAFAQAMEYICDGERRVGNFTLPDLTNWHNTVRTKLRKLRYETSTIVSGTMEKYNIGPVGRLGLELVPSAFLHSKMRKDQRGKSNYTPNQMSEAYDQLSQFDE